MTEEVAKNAPPLFYSPLTVPDYDRSKVVSIRTGITGLDRRIYGLNKQEFSVVSGMTGSGKSTVLIQMALATVQQGKKVAVFSGEINERKTMSWVHLLAAGKTFVFPTQYELFYDMEPRTRESIKQWLEGSFYLYNNDYGNKAETLLAAMQHCIKTKQVDIIILDNLMSMDIGSTYNNQNEKQTEFIWKVRDFAIKYNVHVIVVAHPRKTIGFLRMMDIAGTMNLVNAAHNVFIVHRIGNDFRRLSQATMGWRDGHPIYNYNNCIEICKNRDFGASDEMIGLYYDPMSKQMSCDGEEIEYAWRNERVQEQRYIQGIS